MVEEILDCTFLRGYAKNPMWQTGTCYDAELHQKNQLKHGSWVLLKLQTA